MSEKNNLSKGILPEKFILDEILKSGWCGYCLYSPSENVIEMSLLALKMLGLNSMEEHVDFENFKKALFTKDDQKSFEDGISQLIERGQSFIFDFKTLVESNGQRESKVFILKFSKITEDILIGVFTDITAQRKAEKEIKRFRSNVNKEENFKSVFLKNLSHEIRTPMNAILGFSELLGLPDVSVEDVKNYTSIIRNKGHYMLSFMDDLIELSKFESDNIVFNKTEFELKPLLTELYEEFETRRIDRRKDNIQLQLKIPEGLENIIIYTDPGRLQQILGNLLSNALKFTEKGRVEFGFHKSTKNYKFYVLDTGIGLSEEDQKKIFHRFEVLEDTTAKRLGGTGLSLTITKRIVEKLGGKIRVNSRPAEGSRFQLNIPIESPGKDRFQDNFREIKENKTLADINWKDKVILIAEDEEVNYRFLEALLQQTGVKILRARNGKEAVELCRNIAQIDLVLMDLKMPVLSGFEAIEIIKKEKPYLPVIAQTAFTEHSEIIKCKNIGCDDYVTKPIDISDLLTKIENLL